MNDREEKNVICKEYNFMNNPLFIQFNLCYFLLMQVVLVIQYVSTVFSLFQIWQIRHSPYSLLIY